MEMPGVTGHVRLDDSGKRAQYELKVIELGNEGWEVGWRRFVQSRSVSQQMGIWNSSSGFNMTMNYGKKMQEVIETLENKTLRVTVILVSTKKRFISKSTSCRKSHL